MSPARASVLMILLGGTLGSCGGGNSVVGRRILEDLERSHVPAPDANGLAENPPPIPELPPSGPVTLADLLSVAEATNPALAAARSRVGVAAGQAWQASLYPNPRGDATVEDISFGDGFSGSKTTVGITQPFIIGDRRSAAMGAADAERAARLAEVEARRRAVFGDIAIEHARLIAIREQVRLYGELRDLTDRTLSAAQTRFEARAAPETDVIRPRVERYRIDATLARLAHEEAAVATQLGLLLGGVEIDASRLEGAVPLEPGELEIDRLHAAVRATHPSLAVADREVEAAEARLKTVIAEKTPDLDVRVAAGYRGDGDDWIVDLGAGVTIPLWDDRRGDVLSGRYELMQARQQRTVIEHDLLGRLAAAAGEYGAAKAQLDAFRDKIVPDAERSFEQTGEGYRGGRSSFLDLLDAQRTLTEARATLLELASAAAVARARVIQIVGPNPGGLPEAEWSPGQPPGIPSSSEQRPEGAEVEP